METHQCKSRTEAELSLREEQLHDYTSLVWRPKNMSLFLPCLKIKEF